MYYIHLLPSTSINKQTNRRNDSIMHEHRHTSSIFSSDVLGMYNESLGNLLNIFHNVKQLQVHHRKLPQYVLPSAKQKPLSHIHRSNLFAKINCINPYFNLWQGVGELIKGTKEKISMGHETLAMRGCASHRFGSTTHDHKLHFYKWLLTTTLTILALRQDSLNCIFIRGC